MGLAAAAVQMGTPMTANRWTGSSRATAQGPSSRATTAKRKQHLEQDNTTSYIIGAVFAVLVLAAAVIFLVVRYQRYQRSRMATDFKAQLEQMMVDGLVDPGQISGDRVPRELKRGWLMFLDKLGEGAFGEVWKGLLNDGDNSYPGVPGGCQDS